MPSSGFAREARKHPFLLGCLVLLGRGVLVLVGLGLLSSKPSTENPGSASGRGANVAGARPLLKVGSEAVLSSPDADTLPVATDEVSFQQATKSGLRVKGEGLWTFGPQARSW